MSHLAFVTAQMLKEAKRSLAERVCVRAADVPADTTRAAAHIEQVEVHLHVLAACIGFASPRLFDDYVRWSDRLPESVAPPEAKISRLLSAVSDVLESELPAEAFDTATDYIDRAMRSLEIDAGERLPPPRRTGNRELQRRYLSCLLENRRSDALKCCEQALSDGTGIESLYLDVIQPTQYELGALWQSGTLSVAQEHYCTAATQFVMSQLQPYFVLPKRVGHTLVASCVGDELHEVGLRIITDLFEANGWNTVYLGANTPADSIAEWVASQGAAVLAVSTTMSQHLFGVAAVIEAVRRHPGCQRTKIIVGGHPFNVDPFLWRRVGADADAVDAEEAIQVANQLVADIQPLVPCPANFDGQFSVSLPDETSADSDDDLSRINNTLITLQRELHQANTKLLALNDAYQQQAESLRRSDRRKDEFLAMLAHELRGPLAPIELAVDLLRMEGTNPETLREATATMKRQLQQMNRLISDLLDAARVAHGKIELRKDLLRLPDIVHRAVEIVRPLVEQKRQRLELELGDASITVEADEIRLSQILANLLTNASKYTEPEGLIQLSIRRVRDVVEILVRDNGIGIDPSLLPDIFSTFSQEQRARKHSMGGLGLGLSLVKQLVELHGGTVQAKSEGAGRGSEFVVKLPIIEDDSSLPRRDDGGDQRSSQKYPARRILIVDDQAGIARMTALLLEKLGHHPIVALDGRTALRKFDQVAPEIVIMDLTLPDIGGLETTRRIRQLDESNATLIVALTGHSDDEHRQLAKQSGCDEYLVKPVDISTLKQLAVHPKLMLENRLR